MNIRSVATAAVATGLFLHTPAFAQVESIIGASTVTDEVDPDAPAKKNWRTLVARNPASEEGCFHVTYPDYVWKKVACNEAKPLVHSQHAKSAEDQIFVVGDHNDWVAHTAGLTRSVEAHLQITGLTAEQSVGVAAYQNRGTLGPNEYTLQLNTNDDGTSTACGGCRIWQQFVYSTDFYGQGSSAIVVQTWELGYASGCDTAHGWKISGQDCYYTQSTQAPNIPISDLENVSFDVQVIGRTEYFSISYGTEGANIAAHDNLGIVMVWQNSEFNIFGDGGGSEAVFNAGVNVNVQLYMSDGSPNLPSCLPDIGTTGETNNLNLGTCQEKPIIGPTIVFNESRPNLVRYLLPPTIVKGSVLN